MAEFSGEQKLRIVLESILRKVPKEDQCKKYGISEKEFDSWNDKLINEGGQIFDEKVGKSSSNTSRKRSSLRKKSKYLLIPSLCLNLALLIFAIAWYLLKEVDVSGYASDQNLQKTKLSLQEIEPKISEQQVSPDPVLDRRVQEKLAIQNNPAVAQTNPDVLSFPDSPINNEIIPPVEERVREVNLLGTAYEGLHAVYLLDAGTDEFRKPEDYMQFAKRVSAIKESIQSLSSYSYFNLVMFWNLREASALGKTILPATGEYKNLAIQWLDSLGKDPYSLKENRGQFYTQELLSAKPMAGVVGPWYGINTAISFDPDLIFAFMGGISGYKVSNIPKFHFSGLGIDPSTTANSISGSFSPDQKQPISNYIRQTAVRWLMTVENGEDLPRDQNSLENMAMTRLGLNGDVSSVFGRVEIPWGKSFENFLKYLNVSLDALPQVHFFVSLSEGTYWPTGLKSSILEFVDSSRGTFSLNPLLP